MFNFFFNLKHLKQIGVSNKIVEFFGPGVLQISITDRITIANMCPEYGATIGFFPVDISTVEFLVQTGRNIKHIRCIEEYLKTVKLFQIHEESDDLKIVYSQVYDMNLSSVIPSVSGPKRFQDKVFVFNLAKEFQTSLTNKIELNVCYLSFLRTSLKLRLFKLHFRDSV